MLFAVVVMLPNPAFPNAAFGLPKLGVLNRLTIRFSTAPPSAK